MTTTPSNQTTPATTPIPSATTTTRHPGSCHCGAVRFQVELAHPLKGSRCNCSICTKTAIVTAIARPSALAVTAGEEALAFYEWGGKTGRRYFCKHCGIQCFGRGHLPELGGDYVSINLNAVDDIDVAKVPLVHWDGRHDNWYAGSRPTPWPVFEA